MKVTALALVMALAMSAFAERPPVDITLWRGETRAIEVPGKIELGECPAGLNLRRGVVMPVKYRLTPQVMQLGETYDRVVWGGKGFGPQVVEISVPSDAKPGNYQCGTMEIKVIDRVMPPAKEWKYFLDLWQHPWAVARYHNATPFSKEHYAAMRPVWELLASAGQKCITTTLLNHPWNHQCRDAYGSMIGRVKRDDGSWRFDYSLFDEYVEFALDCGLGPYIACYTMCPWGFGVDWQNEKGETISAVALPGTREFEDYWGEFLVDFAAHLKVKGWFANTFIAMDEREPKDVAAIANLIQSKAPGMKISMAGNRKPSDFVGIKIDNYCQIISHLNDEFLAEVKTRRSQGYLTTFYVCCSPDIPNTFLTSKIYESFYLGAYPAMAGLDGFLRWAWNSWPEDPLRDGSFGHWKSGDTYLVYPNGEPSWRFLMLREGIQCAEKMRILEEQGLFTDEIAKLRQRYDYKAAMADKIDFNVLRKATLSLVNKQ